MLIGKTTGIGVSETTHTTHDSKNIVVGSVNSYLTRSAASNTLEIKDESGVINSRHIAGSRWLMFFGLRRRSRRFLGLERFRGAGMAVLS